ncbi:MAG: hypothetical protein O8C61_10215 [Candidatus Methanoperedens sp.]|nr:hypothetical protein [Candidatus Methanoperedens sp.]
MKLWMTLYAMIWIAFIEFMLAMKPGASIVLQYLHIALGLVIIGLASYNFNGVRLTAVPGRVKRIAKSTFNLSVVSGILGVLLYLGTGASSPILFGVTFGGMVLFLHVVVGFAIITQAAAVAIAYDMWEDKEFVKETAPGEVPEMPMPARK